MLIYNTTGRKNDTDPLIRVLSGREKKGDHIIMKRILAVLLMLAILLCGLTVTANAASPWKKDASGKWTYTKADGTLATDEWIKDGGSWYYFSGTEMVANDLMFIDGKYYGFGASGAMVSNGWFEKKYAPDADGIVWTDWFYAGADGAFIRGWKLVGGKWYYFEDNTDYAPVMARGLWTINEKHYAFTQSGAMIVGWGQPWKGSAYSPNDTNWVYASKDGTLLKGWQKIDGIWYYFDPDWPVMAREGAWWFNDEAPYQVYCFNKSGAMVSNAWCYDKWWECWFYCGADGITKKGWFKDQGKWYYLEPNYGIMQSNRLIEMSDGKTYGFKKSGEMAVGWWEYEGEWYYFSTSGAMVEKQWVQTGAKWYYLKEGGMMAKSETLTIDGKDYTFGADGVWIK